MASKTKQISDAPRATNFVAEMPATQKEAEEKAPMLVTSRPESRLIGQLVLNYIPLKDGLPTPPNLVTPMWASRVSDGVLLLHGEYSVTNDFMRAKLLNNYTMEAYVKCDFKASDGPLMSFILVHIEPMMFNFAEKLKDTSVTTLDAIFRPPLVNRANDHTGAVTYNLNRSYGDICIESVELKLNHATLTAWTFAVNDQIRIAHGQLPIVDMANFSIQRFPPGSSQQNAIAQNTSTQNMTGQNNTNEVSLPPQFPESARVVNAAKPTPPSLDQLKKITTKKSVPGIAESSVAPPTMEQLSKMTATVKPLMPPTKSPVATN